MIQFLSAPIFLQVQINKTEYQEMITPRAKSNHPLFKWGEFLLLFASIALVYYEGLILLM